MSLESLPLEIIHEIASHLPRRDAVNLGIRIYNKQIIASCEPLIKPIAVQKRFELRMLKRFGQDFSEISNWPTLGVDEYNRFGFDKKFGPYKSNRHPNGDHVEPFTGNLYWLLPFERPKEKLTYRQAERYSTDSTLRVLQEQASTVGVRIPDAFLKLFSEDNLQARMDIEGGGFYVELGDCLRKCVPSMQDNENDAYVIRFYADQQGCGYWVLYLDAGPEQGHCVLSSVDDPNAPYMDEEYTDAPEAIGSSWGGDEVEAEIKEIVDAGSDKVAWMRKDDLEVVSCDFEEWLFKNHLELCFDMPLIEDEPNEIGEVDEKYVRVNFSSAGC